MAQEGTTIEREVGGENQRWYLARLLPYRASEQKIDGTVLTFIDISKGRAAWNAVTTAAPGSALVFGRESVGLPDALLEAHAAHVYGIPTIGAVRSLNLASAASIVVYEALRQLGAWDATFNA